VLLQCTILGCLQLCLLCLQLLLNLPVWCSKLFQSLLALLRFAGNYCNASCFATALGVEVDITAAAQAAHLRYQGTHPFYRWLQRKLHL